MENIDIGKKVEMYRKEKGWSIRELARVAEITPSMLSQIEVDAAEATNKKRALSLDVARGSMLFLIILSHIPLFLYMIEPGVLTKVAGSTPLDHFLNFLMEIIVDNRARPLFAILFGYGLVMIYRKQQERKGADEAKRIIKRRCWYLIIFGAILKSCFISLLMEEADCCVRRRFLRISLK